MAQPSTHACRPPICSSVACPCLAHSLKHLGSCVPTLTPSPVAGAHWSLVLQREVLGLRWE